MQKEKPLHFPSKKKAKKYAEKNNLDACPYFRANSWILIFICPGGTAALTDNQNGILISPRFDLINVNT